MIQAETSCISIGTHTIGDGHPVFCIAEAGTTANGNMETAKALIEVAAKSGFDAIKFQTIDPEQLSDKSTVYRYQTMTGQAEENMYEMFKGLVFTPDQWHELARKADAEGILFFSTIDYPAGVDMLLDCGVPAFKVGSWDVTFDQLVVRLARTGRPILFDLGPAMPEEVARFLRLCRENGNTSLLPLHDFHTQQPEEMHMRTIQFLKHGLGLPAGFSSPGRDIDLDLMAVALAANALEKRISLSRDSAGHHHVLCLEPHECGPWIERIRRAEQCLGKAGIFPSQADLRDAMHYYRSLATCAPIAKGERYSWNNLDAKRPGTGIPMRHADLFIGREAKRDIPADCLLTWEDF